MIVLRICAISSVGRAARLHREGRGFKSLIAHKAKNASHTAGCFLFLCRQGLESRRTTVRGGVA